MEEKVKNNERNYSLDLLRIFSIILIIVFHVCYKSLDFSKLTGLNQIIVGFFWHFGEIGVNLFMLITGYFLYKSEKSQKSKIIRLIYDIWLYYIFNIITLIFVKGGYTITYNALFPVSLGNFWYITSYIVILLLAPYLNKLIKNLNYSEHKKLLIIFFIVFSLIPTISGLSIGTTENGVVYSRFAWLIYIYFLGAFISKYQDKDKILIKNRKFFIKLLVLLIISLLCFMLITKYLLVHKMPDLKINYMWPPNSVIVFLISLVIFVIFTKISIIKQGLLTRIIKNTSPHVLGVYLFHDSPYNYVIFSEGIIWLNNLHAAKRLVPTIILISLAFFIAGLVISIIKKYTFDKIYQKIILKVDKKFNLQLSK